uniref:Uncharacterized protein n=1 Tax=Siphoviridae sp. ctRNB7 TaxID=2825502 RepID=A0A8S5PWY4_9CAUD|nr:MAG TPA: hypothetical protein [Siphoviridae sp. ctRNB7]DAP64564.1 MAG TPA: hypothetical protein [Caudoviricetes sp.]
MSKKCQTISIHHPCKYLIFAQKICKAGSIIKKNNNH